MQKGFLLKDGGGVIRSKIAVAGDWTTYQTSLEAAMPGYTVEVYDDTDSTFTSAVVVIS